MPIPDPVGLVGGGAEAAVPVVKRAWCSIRFSFSAISNDINVSSAPRAGNVPGTAELPTFRKRADDRFKERSYGYGDIPEISRRVGKLGLSDEPLPLNLLAPVHPERRIENRWAQRNRRVSIRECPLNGLGEDFPIEVE